MRSFCGVVLAVSLISSSAFAADSSSMAPLAPAGSSIASGNDNSGPLAPGKPAGTDEAKLKRGTGTLLLLGGGAILAAVLFASSGTFGGGTPATGTQ